MRPVALTCGDPSGIGPEVTLAAWRALREEIAFFLIGDAAFMAGLGGQAGIPVRRIEAARDAVAAMAEGLPVLHRPLAAPARPGAPAPENAEAVVGSIREAVALVKEGAACAVCTNPINKSALRSGACFAYPGHTEFLGALCGGATPVMMLASQALRVVPVTVHIALADVPRRLEPGMIEQTIRITHDALVRDFGIARPRLHVAGLNPHAGEAGLMGREDAEIIAPVVAQLAAEGMGVTGPLPADTMFHERARRGYDAAICMYHDQALIPIKTLDFDGGVNVTLGLDIVRTSPDHGTAYDIAGQGRARADSLIAALRMAASLGGRRREAG